MKRSTLMNLAAATLFIIATLFTESRSLNGFMTIYTGILFLLVGMIVGAIEDLKS